MDLWKECDAAVKPVLLQGTLLRMVESQEQVATSRLVSGFARQAVLEEMLEGSKPALPAAARKLPYLLATPFRYPPLPHGSRFGKRHEPGIFYGSRTLPPLLAEAAYYRFVFWAGMTGPPKGRLLTQHTLFRSGYRTGRGVKLQDPPFVRYRDTLRDPAGYSATQALGDRLRESGIEAFEYESARDPEAGINVALFAPAALKPPRTLRQEEWLCDTSSDTVAFRPKRGQDLHEFPLKTFLVRGKLPTPAV
jgi:RES domain